MESNNKIIVTNQISIHLLYLIFLRIEHISENKL